MVRRCRIKKRINQIIVSKGHSIVKIDINKTLSHDKHFLLQKNIVCIGLGAFFGEF